MKQLNRISFDEKMFSKPEFDNAKIIEVMQHSNKPFKPSIKFDPLISINKQNVVKKILNTEFFKKLSKKVNFDESISKSKKITDKKTKVI